MLVKLLAEHAAREVVAAADRALPSSNQIQHEEERQ